MGGEKMKCKHALYREYWDKECACVGCDAGCSLDDPCEICLGPIASQCVIIFEDEDEDKRWTSNYEGGFEKFCLPLNPCSLSKIF